MEETQRDIAQMPLINCPREKGSYKFVQFYGPSDRPIARIASTFADHPNIAMHFAAEAGIEGKYDQTERKFFLPDDCGFRLVGAGFCRINLEERLVKYGGRSSFLNIGPDRDHLQKLMSHFPEWTAEYDWRF